MNSKHCPPLVFVGGIHGVGKSTLCRKALEPCGYHCVSASALIFRHQTEAPVRKHVADVSGNQDVLLEQLAIEKEQYPRLVLDGHFTLLGPKRNIELIEVRYFEAMGINRLVLIKGDPMEISERLKSRDGEGAASVFTALFQEKEEEHATFIAEAIGVPLQVFSNNVSEEEFVRAVLARDELT